MQWRAGVPSDKFRHRIRQKVQLINDTINIVTEKNGIPVELALRYNTSFTENVFTYVNNINTIEGGTHLTGFRRGLTQTLKSYAESSGMLSKLKFDINGDDFREELKAIAGRPGDLFQ